MLGLALDEPCSDVAFSLFLSSSRVFCRAQFEYAASPEFAVNIMFTLLVATYMNCAGWFCAEMVNFPFPAFPSLFLSSFKLHFSLHRSFHCSLLSLAYC
jgi:hypothetical protein